MCAVRSKGFQKSLSSATSSATPSAPFRPLPPLAPSLLVWDGGLVVKLAEAAYDHRTLPSGHLEPDRLAVLCDALEDAGCTDATLLEHLRSEGPHVRGWWAVDAVLSTS